MQKSETGMGKTGAERLQDGDITEAVIGAAIRVHRSLGPGLLESVYEVCLAHELTKLGFAVERQVSLPVVYDNIKLDCGFRIDMLVADIVVVELKCVEKLLPVHEAQLLTYLRLSGKRTGLLFNFMSKVLTDNMMRRVV